MIEILKKIPRRTNKPRNNGLTMMMDKGLSIRQAEDFLASSHQYTDIIKLGFGTSIITPNITDKIKLYQQENIVVYTGGTLFEAFAIRNQIDDYKKYLDKIGINSVEISDGSMSINHKKKCDLIKEFSKDFIVISEVGSKKKDIELSNEDWLKLMQDELSAGSWKVIAEAREGGNIGIFDADGNIKDTLISKITNSITPSKILWEAPKKDQQVWFINNFGANVNLGNISPDDIISLECLRLGLRGDTFENYL